MESIRTVKGSFGSARSQVFCVVLYALGCGDGHVPRGVEDGGPDATSLPDDDGDGFPEGHDCDDGDPTIHPGAPDDEGTGEWRTQVVVGGPGQPRIAAAMDGTLHLGYAAEGIIRHATLQGHDWTLEPGYECGSMLVPISMGADGHGRAHFAFMDGDHRERGLWYARTREGVWFVERIDADADLGWAFAIAVEEDGVAHVVYEVNLGSGAYELRHATNLAGEWREETVERPTATPENLSLAMDRAGRLHAAYLGDDGFVHHLAGSDGAWTSEHVDSIHERRWFMGGPDIALGPDGVAHIAYRELVFVDDVGWPETWELRIASDATGSWERVLTVEETIPQWIRLALDAHGATHVAYTEWDSFVRYVSDAGGVWTMETIDRDARDLDIAVDAFGAVHIAYTAMLDEWTPEIRYATNRLPPDGVDRDCDGQDG